MPRILVIDDEAEIRTAIERRLRAAGYEVVGAEDGDQGVKVADTTHPDLVVTDLFMPNKEGLETIRELREKYPAMKIIAMSGDLVAGSMLTVAERMGADRILHKPFGPDMLLDLVKELLE